MIGNIRSITGFLVIAVVICFFSGDSALIKLVKAENINVTYPVVDTGQERCFSNDKEIEYPAKGEPFYGQDAQYSTNSPSYRDNNDGTVTDLVTGLMWQKTNDFNTRLTFAEAVEGAADYKLAGYNDWRLPTVKELYSLVDFSGCMARNPSQAKPYIDTRFFNLENVNERVDGRFLAGQYWSSTEYVGRTKEVQRSVFCVNFVTGVIVAYPKHTKLHGDDKRYVRYVRGNPAYGKNQFIDNGDGTITDLASGLMWMKKDSGQALNWEQALGYAENLDYGGYNDWRLPNAKELQSIVDYTRAPDAVDNTRKSAAIDPIFAVTDQESYFWTSTTHLVDFRGNFGMYASFGQAMGQLHGQKKNVHGAGAMRSDPKSDNHDYALHVGRGPMKDDFRVYNYARAVRGGKVKIVTTGPPVKNDFNSGRESALKQPGLQMANDSNGTFAQRSSSGGDKGGDRSALYDPERRHAMGKPAPQRPMDSRVGFIKRLDKDGDNRVSREEFDGPSTHFEALDRNKDGYLVDEERPSLSFPFFLHAGFENLSFSDEEVKWLKTHPVIHVSVNRASPPISIWEGDDFDPESGKDHPEAKAPGGQSGKVQGRASSNQEEQLAVRVSGRDNMFKGVAADYLKEVSRLLGVRFNVTLVTNQSSEQALNALKRQEVDLILPVMAGRKSDDSANITVPFVQVPIVIVTRTNSKYLYDLRKLKSMRVAGVKSVQGEVEGLGLGIKFEQISLDVGLKEIATGRIDAYVADLSQVSYYLSESPVPGVKISGELPATAEYAFAVGSHSSVLVNILNKTIKALPRDTKKEIRDRWFSDTYEKGEAPSSWTNGLGIVGIIAFALTLCWSLYLFRRFRKVKTAVEALDPHLLSVHIDDNVSITEVTEALCKATGFTNQELIGKPLMTLGKPIRERSGSFDTNILNSIQEGKLWKGEVRIVRKDGSSMWADAVISPLRRKREKASGYTVIYQDVSERKRFESLASRDELTGLYNRRYYNEAVPVLLKRARLKECIFAMFLLDVDNFKDYNDTYGHPAGDVVLASIGKELKRIFKRTEDMTFRMGGEEFGALLIAPTMEDVEMLAEEILLGIRSLKITHEKNSPGIVTVSVGVKAVAMGDLEDKKSVYQKADQALYKAKQSGKDCYVIADN